MARAAQPPSPAVGWGGGTAGAAPAAARGAAAAARRADTSRRASQGVLAAAVREMRSQGRARPAR